MSPAVVLVALFLAGLLIGRWWATALPLALSLGFGIVVTLLRGGIDSQPSDVGPVADAIIAAEVLVVATSAVVLGVALSPRRMRRARRQEDRGSSSSPGREAAARGEGGSTRADRTSHGLRAIADRVGQYALGYRWLFGLAVLVGTAGWQIAFFDQNAHGAWSLIALALGFVLAGLVIREWPALSLAIVPTLVALPFGSQDHYLGNEGSVLWFDELFATPVYLVLIGAGVLLGRSRKQALASLTALCLGAGIAITIPVVYATVASNPTPPARQAGLPLLVAQLGQPGGLCQHMTERFGNEHYGVNGGRPFANCMDQVARERRGPLAVGVVRRTADTAILSIPARGKTIYFEAVRAADRWLIDDVATSPNKLPPGRASS